MRHVLLLGGTAEAGALAAALADVFMPERPAGRPADRFGAELVGAELVGEELVGAGLMGAGPGGAEPMDAEPMDAEPMGARPMGAGPMGAGPMGAGPGGAGPGGPEPRGAEPKGTVGVPALRITYSYAGRTSAPLPQPVPVRVGGFGGAAGLADYIRANSVTHVIDATHPFAARISRNAVDAARMAGVPLCVLERPQWQAEPGDRWILVPDIEGAVAALPQAPARVFLAIGRQQLPAFAARPEHHYILRLVDPPLPGTLPLRGALVIVARGPFAEADDLRLLRQNAVDVVVAKNAGGAGGRAKIDAARALGLPVVMISRPAEPAEVPPEVPPAMAAGVSAGVAAGLVRDPPADLASTLPRRARCGDVGAVLDWLHATPPFGTGIGSGAPTAPTLSPPVALTSFPTVPRGV